MPAGMPQYASNAILGAGAGSGFNAAMFGGGLGQLLGGLFGDSGAPYEDAMNQYKQYMQKAENVENPFINAGTGAIGNYQDWLKTMQNPSGFINNLMGQYQESPFAQYQQKQAMRAAQNMGSASGLTGSTPLQLQAQQNASNISSQDMNQWLQNVLGINTQYGSGNQYLMGLGQNSANALAGMYENMGNQMGQVAYGQGAAENNDFMNTILGGAQLAAQLAML